MSKKKKKKLARHTGLVQQSGPERSAPVVAQGSPPAAPAEPQKKSASWLRFLLPMWLMGLALMLLFRGGFSAKTEPPEQAKAKEASGLPAPVLSNRFSPPDEGFLALNPVAWLAGLKDSDAPNTVLLDVRTAGEVAHNGIERAGLESVHLDFHSRDFDRELNRLNKSLSYFVYCSSGYRSGRTVERMRELGFKRAFNLSGGFSEFVRLGLPTTDASPEPAPQAG